MAIKIQELAFVLKAVDYLSPVLKSVDQRIGHLNETVKSTQRFREAAENYAAAGAGIAAVGAAVAVPLAKSISDYEQLQDHVARVATAMGDVPDKARLLAQSEEFVKQQAVATGYSMDRLTESVYQGLSGFLDMQQSLAVTAEAAKLARATTGDLADTTSALTTMMLNFGDKTKTPIQNVQMLSDKMAALQTQFKFTNLTDLTEAMKIAAPQAMAYHVSLDQLLASMATLSASGETGEKAGSGFLELMNSLTRASHKLGFEVLPGANGKGIDLLKTLQGIKAQFGDIGANKDVATEFTKAFNSRGFGILSLMLQHLDRFGQAMNGAANSSGKVDRAFGEFQKRGTLGFLQLEQSLAVFMDTIGGALAPTVEKIAVHLTSLAQHAQHFAEANPQVVKFVALFAGLAAVLAIVAGGLLVIGGGILAVASFAPAFAGIVGTIAAIGIGLAGLTAALATWAPSVLHQVAAVIEGIPSFLKTFATAMVTSGEHLVLSLAQGIENAALAPVHAIAAVAARIRAHLPFSPAETGPLRDLNRVRIVQTIAETIKPAPMLDAIRRVATATALALPMTIGAVAPGASAGWIAGRAGGATVHYSPTIHVNAQGGDPAAIRSAVVDALRANVAELRTLLDAHDAVRDRTRF